MKTFSGQWGKDCRQLSTDVNDPFIKLTILRQYLEFLKEKTTQLEEYLY